MFVRVSVLLGITALREFVRSAMRAVILAPVRAHLNASPAGLATIYTKRHPSAERFVNEVMC